MVSSRQARTIFLSAAVLVILGIFFYISTHKSTNNLTLTAQENKFKAEFTLSNYNKSIAEAFLEKAALPKTVLDGFEFSLDATSSAKLAYVSPIKVNLKPQKDKLNFEGQTTSPPAQKSLEINQSFKAPDYQVAVFGQKLVSVLDKNTNSPDLKIWLSENLNNTTGQYLFVFGDKPDFALIFKKDSPPDFESLKSKIQAEGYKEETQDSTTYHLVENYVFFEVGDTVFAASSLDTAKNLASIQKGTLVKQNIFAPETSAAFAALVINDPDKKAQPSLKFLLGDKQKISNQTDKIKSAAFFLSGTKFHGIVELFH